MQDEPKFVGLYTHRGMLHALTEDGRIYKRVVAVPRTGNHSHEQRWVYDGKIVDENDGP